MSAIMPDLSKIQFYGDNGESPDLQHSSDVRHIVRNALTAIIGWNGTVRENLADRRRARIYAEIGVDANSGSSSAGIRDHAGPSDLPS